MRLINMLEILAVKIDQLTTSDLLARYFQLLNLNLTFGHSSQDVAQIQIMLETIIQIIQNLRSQPASLSFKPSPESLSSENFLISNFLRCEKTSPTLNRLLTGKYETPKMLSELNQKQVIDTNTDLWQLLSWLETWKSLQ